MGVGTLLHAAVRRPDRFAGLTLLTPPTAWASRVAQHEVYLRSAALIERGGVEAWSAQDLGVPLPPAICPDRPVTRPDVKERLLPAVFRGLPAPTCPRARS